MRKRLYTSIFEPDHGLRTSLGTYLEGLEYLQWIIADPTAERHLFDILDKINKDRHYQPGRIVYDTLVEVIVDGTDATFVEHRSSKELKQVCAISEVYSLIKERRVFQEEYTTAQKLGEQWRRIRTRISDEDLSRPLEDISEYYDALTGETGLCKNVRELKYWYNWLQKRYGDVKRPARDFIKFHVQESEL